MERAKEVERMKRSDEYKIQTLSLIMLHYT